MKRLPDDIIPPVPAQRIRVVSPDGVRLAVQVHGHPDARTVVLAHGWTLSTGYWSRVVRRLRTDLRVVAYDQRGHGHSTAVPTSGFTTDALADDLAAVLAATVPAGERVVVAGHSMGAMTLIAFAARHPRVLHETVAGGVLISTGAEQLLARSRILPRRRRRVAGLPPDQDEREPTARPSPLERRVDAQVRRVLTEPRRLERIPAPVLRSIITHVTLSRSASPAERSWTTDVVSACPAATTAGFAMMLADLDLSTTVPRLDVPTLVVVGNVDRLTPPWHAHRLAAALPCCLGLVEVPDAGHMTPVQAPDAVAAAVRRVVADCLPERSLP
ncbi:MAG: alpha/beta hydrolase [Kineosporiaceae bacterium]